MQYWFDIQFEFNEFLIFRLKFKQDIEKLISRSKFAQVNAFYLALFAYN